MCGIASLVRRDGGQVDRADVRRMCSAIAHRGPDGAGLALLDNGRVGLGHVRLSIVDPAGGQQPLYNEDFSIAAVCNGEIYDYLQLRRELTRLGHCFRTTSDSELLVHLYEEHDTDFFRRLNGEFAFVLWDAKNRRLIAGRDPCGVKPLYFHDAPGELFFCSEVKGIYALDRIDRRLSRRYLAGPALGVYVDDPSAFDNVRTIRPGHYLMVEPDGGYRECAHFRPRFEPREQMGFEDAAAAVRQTLTTAVTRRLAADVPVHAYLSGGLDSTIVTGLMAQHAPQFTCFNVGFPDSPYDESHKAREIARHFGQRFETVPCDAEKIAANIARAVYCAEMPLNNYNSIAKLILSGHVRSRGEKVCLTGEGSDELFAGYPYFKLEMLWRLEQEGGDAARHSRDLQKRFRQMESRSEGLLWDRSQRWRRAQRLFGYPSFFNLRAKDAARCAKVFLNRQKLGLTAAEIPQNILRSAAPPDRLAGLDAFNRSRLLTLNQLYCVVIPSLGDRVEMGNSLECRPPFLDRDLVDLAGTIPSQHFVDLDRLREKHLLREAFRDLLPPVFQNEHKHPFLAPTWRGFARTCAGKPLFAEFLSSSAIAKAGIFRPVAVRLARLALGWMPLRPGFARKLDALLGTILTVHLLHHQFIENRIACDADFPMADRSPEQLLTQRQAA